MSAPRDRWLDREAGPIVRPYAVTKGRTMPAPDSYIGLIDTVIAQPYAELTDGARLNPEHRRLLGLCRYPVMVVDLASDANLPIGVVRVLLSDLAQWGPVRVIQSPRGRVMDKRLVRDVLDGLLPAAWPPLSDDPPNWSCDSGRRHIEASQSRSEKLHVRPMEWTHEYFNLEGH